MSILMLLMLVLAASLIAVPVLMEPPAPLANQDITTLEVPVLPVPLLPVSLPAAAIQPLSNASTDII